MTRIRRKIIPGLAAVCVVLLLAGAAYAGQSSVSNLELLGLAAGDEKDAKAREAAVADALKRAVAREGVAMVDKGTLAANLPKFEKDILANARRFVAAFSPQAVSAKDGKVVALVSVSVDIASLDKALVAAGLRLSQKPLAETLVLISEEASPGRPPVYWWSGSAGTSTAPGPVKDVLESLGVKMVDPARLAGKVPPEAREPVLTEEQALDLARKCGAGLVILGRVRTYPVVTPEGDPPPLAQIEALEVAQGRVLAMEEEPGPVYRSTPGPEASAKVNQAIEKMMRNIMEQVAGQASRAPAFKGDLALTVSGINSLSGLHRFQRELESLSVLVAGVVRDSVGPGWARFKVKLKVPPAQLADQLILLDFGDFLANVTETGPDTMKVALIPK